MANSVLEFLFVVNSQLAVFYWVIISLCPFNKDEKADFCFIMYFESQSFHFCFPNMAQSLSKGRKFMVRNLRWEVSKLLIPKSIEFNL